MRLGEIVIMWIGGLLVTAVLLSTVEVVGVPRQPFLLVASARFPLTHIAIILLFCVMLWVTIYRRKR